MEDEGAAYQGVKHFFEGLIWYQPFACTSRYQLIYADLPHIRVKKEGFEKPAKS